MGEGAVWFLDDKGGTADEAGADPVTHFWLEKDDCVVSRRRRNGRDCATAQRRGIRPLRKRAWDDCKIYELLRTMQDQAARGDERARFDKREAYKLAYRLRSEGKRMARSRMRSMLTGCDRSKRRITDGIAYRPVALGGYHDRARPGAGAVSERTGPQLDAKLVCGLQSGHFPGVAGSGIRTRCGCWR